MKKSNYPGQLTAAKQVNSRVIPDVSSSEHMSLSTGRKYLQREAADRPANEDEIRGLKITPIVRTMLEQEYGHARVKAAIRDGILEV